MNSSTTRTSRSWFWSRMKCSIVQDQQEQGSNWAGSESLTQLPKQVVQGLIYCQKPSTRKSCIVSDWTDLAGFCHESVLDAVCRHSGQA